MLADNDRVAALQVMLGDFLVVDEGAVGAAQILDEGILANGENVGMFTAHRQVVYEYLAPRLAADFHVALSQVNVVHHVIVELDNDLAHLQYSSPVLNSTKCARMWAVLSPGPAASAAPRCRG